jgi:2-polyprenyl-3-methyl-5-hydroxy-6-metoxy-1,4-benzoquinol methylase
VGKIRASACKYKPYRKMNPMNTQKIKGLAAKTARQVKWEAQHQVIVRGLRPYKPSVLPPEQWEAWFDGTSAYRAQRLTDVHEIASQSVLAGYVKYLEPKTILDLGCGPGLMREAIDGANFRQYTGVDPTISAIESARAKTSADWRTSYIVGDPMDDDLSLVSADVVICSDVLYQVPSPYLFLLAADALLRPGGHLLTSMWRHPGDTVLWDMVDRQFDLVDRVTVRDPANRDAPRGWTIACHRCHR